MCLGSWMMFALAALPTVMEPSAAMFTTLAVVFSPKAFASTSTRPRRDTATHELLVPRSIPMAICAMRSLSAAPSRIGNSAPKLESRKARGALLDPLGARAKPRAFSGG